MHKHWYKLRRKYTSYLNLNNLLWNYNQSDVTTVCNTTRECTPMVNDSTQLVAFSGVYVSIHILWNYCQSIVSIPINSFGDYIFHQLLGRLCRLGPLFKSWAVGLWSHYEGWVWLALDMIYLFSGHIWNNVKILKCLQRRHFLQISSSHAVEIIMNLDNLKSLKS